MEYDPSGNSNSSKIFFKKIYCYYMTSLYYSMCNKC